MNQPNVFKGTVRGKTIELDREPDLPDGQRVTVTLHPAATPELPAGEGLRRACGAWAEDAEELDEFLEWNRQQRRPNRRDVEET